MKNYNCLIFISVLLLNSCISRRYIDIQILNPATVKLLNIKELLVLDERDKLKDSLNMNYYNLLLVGFYRGLKENLKDSPSLKNTIPMLATPEEIRIKKSVADSGQYVLKCNFKLLIDTTSIPGYYTYNCKARFYLFTLKDSTFVDWYQISQSHIFHRTLEDIENQSLLQFFAGKYLKRIAPYWTTEERVFFRTGNKLMRLGYRKFCDNDLDQAILLWRKLYEKGTKPLAARAAYNIALACEMQDDLETSEEWLKTSLQLKNMPETKRYLDIIDKRKQIRFSLDKQVE